MLGPLFLPDTMKRSRWQTYSFLRSGDWNKNSLIRFRISSSEQASGSITCSKIILKVWTIFRFFQQSAVSTWRILYLSPYVDAASGSRMASLPQIFLKSSLLTYQKQLGSQKQYLQSQISVMQLNLSTTLARNFLMYYLGKSLDDGIISLVLERKYCIYAQNDWASFHLFFRTRRFRKSSCLMSNFTGTFVIRDMSKLSIIQAYVNSFKFYSYFLAFAYGFFFDFLSCGLSFYQSIGLDVSFSYYTQLEDLLRPIWAKKHFTASTSYFPVWKKRTADEGSLLASFFPFIALINGK